VIKIKPVTVVSDHIANILTIRIVGDIDHHTAAPLREEIDKEIYLYRCKTVIFDLSEVDFMDSSGLGLLMGRYNLVSELGGKIKIKNAPSCILKILKLSGADKLFIIENNKSGERNDKL